MSLVIVKSISQINGVSHQTRPEDVVSPESLHATMGIVPCDRRDFGRNAKEAGEEKVVTDNGEV